MMMPVGEWPRLEAYHDMGLEEAVVRSLRVQAGIRQSPVAARGAGEERAVPWDPPCTKRD